MRRIIIYWSFFSLALIFGYTFLQVLHAVNFWDSISVFPAPDHIEPFSTVGMVFFSSSLVLGWSLIISFLIWKLIAKLYSPNQPVLRLFFEIIQSWVSLSIFEVISLANFIIFSTVITRSEYSFSISGQILLEVAWINLILVCLFYTFIGFQAYRKSLKKERFVSRLAYDVIQVSLMAIETVLIFFPFGFYQYLTSVENYPLILNSLAQFSYNVFLGLLIIEFFIWIDNRIKREEKSIDQKTSFEIVILQTSKISIPLIILITLVPDPFFLPIQFRALWIFLVVIIIITSISISLVYTFAKIKAPRSYGDVLSIIRKVKYKFEVLIASRGTMFNYPAPIDIFIGGELTEKIEHRWEKVTLKMACGQCYHVFTAETFKKGTNFKPIVCAFCGSLATTPVWE